MTTEFIVLPDQQNIHVSQSLGACSGTLKLRSGEVELSASPGLITYGIPLSHFHFHGLEESLQFLVNHLDESGQCSEPWKTYQGEFPLEIYSIQDNKLVTGYMLTPEFWINTGEYKFDPINGTYLNKDVQGCLTLFPADEVYYDNLESAIKDIRARVKNQSIKIDEAWGKLVDKPVFNKRHFDRGMRDALNGERATIAIGDYWDGYRAGKMKIRCAPKIMDFDRGK